MYSLEADPVWSTVGSEEYDVKYIKHAIPFIASYAGLRLQELKLQEEIAVLVARKDQLSKDKEHNTLLPSELYNMISSLQEEVKELKEGTKELKQEAKELKEEAKVLKEKVSILESKEEERERERERQAELKRSCAMSVLSAPSLIIWNAMSGELIYNTSDAYNHATAESPLPNDRASSWIVHIDNHPRGQGYSLLLLLSKRQSPGPS